ncbi:hypothetical protein Sta7437_0558 [Stanieria cyanosphaera PCC 7437]|uniref:Peptidase domain protein n=1 Tax=Stanieria cyanosphaera (strain ATCC 29371 / PCC 7437) TaxID=111780 RepID=K9XPY7_STAC7|nr:hypothetical protein [Stanieria cyanosphaera]AFZ34159.1 hypothetical protein Sta7437_0558 [Stanieria cyanosphaera PCC 7437]
MLKSRSPSLILIVLSGFTLPILPVLAQKYDFNDFSLAAGFNPTEVIVTGYTSGAYSLASIVNQDKYGNPCMGYGDPKPDHVMILEDDFPELTIQIDSGGQDTTLVIKSFNNDIRCGFGQNNLKDALVKGSDWQAGEYYIWVGSIVPNQKANYRLSVK